MEKFTVGHYNNHVINRKNYHRIFELHYALHSFWLLIKYYYQQIWVDKCKPKKYAIMALFIVWRKTDCRNDNFTVKQSCRGWQVFEE